MQEIENTKAKGKESAEISIGVTLEGNKNKVCVMSSKKKEKKRNL